MPVTQLSSQSVFAAFHWPPQGYWPERPTLRMSRYTGLRFLLWVCAHMAIFCPLGWWPRLDSNHTFSVGCCRLINAMKTPPHYSSPSRHTPDTLPPPPNTSPNDCSPCHTARRSRTVDRRIAYCLNSHFRTWLIGWVRTAVNGIGGRSRFGLFGGWRRAHKKLFRNSGTSRDYGWFQDRYSS